MAKIIGTSLEDLKAAAEALSQGRLVAIPTETVYGLGGNAHIESAAKNIYVVKGRPPTDPLICHVNALERARQLWDPELDERTLDLACTIGKGVWPGPLTIVCRANPSLPRCVTGDSGFVGARIPQNPVTLKLLEMVDFPVAAPSANTFGHVSPTTAQHVYDDLASRDPELLIIDGGQCSIGIESTVIKVNNMDSVEVLRRGKITVSMIHSIIADKYPSTQVVIRDTKIMCGSGNAPMESPGQLLTHYSPKIPSSLITPGGLEYLKGALDQNPYSLSETYVHRGREVFPLSKTVVLDFHGFLSRLKNVCMMYRDLSPTGNAEEGCFAVFDALRSTELVNGALNVVFPYVSEWPHTEGSSDLLAAMEDRLFRAASGVTAMLATVNLDVFGKAK